MKLAVIGRGMIGSAATRHLAEAGYNVTLIGTREPEAYATHDGVFASHYDEGRITRGLDQNRFWSDVSRASIARYRKLEAATGTRFYEEVGVLMAGPQGRSLIDAVLSVAQSTNIDHDQLDAEQLAQRFPYFHFPQDTLGVFETTNAGYINPRRMVQAQLIAAKNAGAHFVDGVAGGLNEAANGISVDVGGANLNFDRVLLATGGFTQSLLGDEVPLNIYARTVALFSIDADEQCRLAGMPSHISLLEDGRDPYLLPPILYPDGSVCLKLGGDPEDNVLENTQDVKDWFRSGGSQSVGQFLEHSIREKMPNLRIIETRIAPCVTSFTEDELPVIRALTGRVAVAVGGNGKGAKNSDELGRLGAEALVGQPVV
ncbi:MAG: FAD-dependent oxidoreductase [Paracoccaceae bacterium]|nr:FAD-dependent oxidoreductase [Paracoccaceae bacterium]MDG1737943.1 FAD-dependent oxidoreductase [Paracoccaceae bacterium]MDG2258819.1 FAD-dependent oxidoreductase [Paracoccaceae bacterium]